tara:strand:- start:413 stop:1291 length:879 start_codon:yes stop_codon:yes gene_type:complete
MNKIYQLLIDSKITHPKYFQIFHKGTRDTNKVNVLRCSKTGILILDRNINNDKSYQDNTNYAEEGKVFLKNNVVSSKRLDDTTRRANEYLEIYNNKKVIDFGCGKGEFIEAIAKKTKNIYGVELNKINRNRMNEKGFNVFESLDNIKEKVDVVFANHVLEHLTDPQNIIAKIKDKLKLGGIFVVEVPHAKDLLIQTLNLESFKNFTFWSEHLILHTSDSLSKFVSYFGFETEKIYGEQRYPISNHLHWIHKNEPGGHEKLTFLNNKSLNNEYKKALQKVDKTDTLIGFFKNK